MSEKKPCDCPFCQETHRYYEIIDKLSGYDRMFMERIYMKLVDVETQNARYDAILKGTWPDSIEILEDALKKIRNSVQSP